MIKKCDTMPNKDNNTLLLGIICNIWTKEAIKQTWKDYGVQGVKTQSSKLDGKNFS